MAKLVTIFTAFACCARLLVAQDDRAAIAAEAHLRGQRFERAVSAMQRVLRVWLTHADERTLLLPDRVPGPGSGLRPDDRSRLYTPHNSGADLYPYLILTAELTDPDLYRGRMMEMLRNEIRYTNTGGSSIPGNLSLATGELGPPSLFGAGEYAKDGLLTVTEYLGRTAWYYRMVDMVADAMAHAPVESRFGKLPASDSELNGDYLQVLARLGNMTGDQRFVDWARRIGDAYIEEVIPGSHDVPSGRWDFAAHTGDQHLRLRDHGNELVVGLVLQYANEQRWKTPRAETWRPVIARMLDRILASANPDGLLYDEVDTATLKPIGAGLSDNWGYIYGAVYTFYQCTGDTRYRDAVVRVLHNLPKYRRHVWEPRAPDLHLPLGSFDGYADSIESALYLVAREPVPEALDWIESEMQVMFDMQRPDGHFEYWYGEGNFNRTAMLYALMQSRGVRPAHWQPGMQVGAVQRGTRLHLRLGLSSPTTIRFDYARHRRILNLDRNYVRLNEFPEWFVVDENTLYRLSPSSAGDTAGEIVRLGSELIDGVTLGPGDWIVEPLPASGGGQTPSLPPSGQLSFGAFSARFAPDLTFTLEGEGWPPFKGSWKADGDQIELLVPKGARGCDGPGRYRFRVDRGHVTFDLVSDSCEPRRMILDRSAWRPAEETRVVAARRIERTVADSRPLPAPTASDGARSWPSFRGPGASGIAEKQALPDTWNVNTGQNVLWRTPIPGLAHSSPIVWGDRIFVTSAISSRPNATFRPGLYGDGDASDDRSRHRWVIYAIDKRTGKTLWERVAHEGEPLNKRHIKSTYASSSPATDGRIVVAWFGSQGVYAYTLDGTLRWKVDLGRVDMGAYDIPTFEWGPASSPIIWNGLVILQCDTQADSFVLALNADTGETVWKTERNELPSWGTPTVAMTSTGPELVTNASNFIRGYDPRTGKELWKVGHSSKLTAPTPVATDDLFVVASGRAPERPIFVIRAGARGDLTLRDGETRSQSIVWSRTARGSYMPTPLIYGSLLYVLANNGVLDAYTLKTGDEIYRQRLSEIGNGYSASPVAADGKIYLSSEDGEMLVVESGPIFRHIATNSMGEPLMATPALSEGVMYVRSSRTLFAIGRPR